MFFNPVANRYNYINKNMLSLAELIVLLLILFCLFKTYLMLLLNKYKFINNRWYKFYN